MGSAMYGRSARSTGWRVAGVMSIVATLLGLQAAFLFAAGTEVGHKTKGDAAAGGTSSTSPAVQQKVLSFNLEGFSEKGAKQWEITGESAEAVKEDQIKLKNIVAKTYGEQAEATLSADKGLYDKAKNNVRLEENVKVLVQDAAAVAGPASGMTALNLSGDKGAAGADPAKPSAKKSGLTTITCDGEVQFDYQKNEAYFSKNVLVVNDDGEIAADRITLYLDIKTKMLKEVVAEGNVKITRGENIAYSEKATYIEAEKKVVLSGAPRLVFYQEGGDSGQQFFGAVAGK